MQPLWLVRSFGSNSGSVATLDDGVQVSLGRLEQELRTALINMRTYRYRPPEKPSLGLS